MVDKLAVINEDGSFDEPKVEAHLIAIAAAYGGGGGGGPALTAYSQVSSLPGYPVSFPPSATLPHAHTTGDITGATVTGKALVEITDPGSARTLLGLQFVTEHRQLPLVNGEVQIQATALNTFPSRAANIPAGYTGGVVWKHAKFGTCTVGPADDANGDIIEDTMP